jgi:hypothetical protein
MAGQTPRRVQRRRVAGWKTPANTVYVGRPSRWGNPFVVGRPVPDPAYGGGRVDSAEMAVLLFRLWLLDQSAAYLADIRTELAGRNLACWCPPGQPCHADVLLTLANGGRS